jgi:hypothetical protein
MMILIVGSMICSCATKRDEYEWGERPCRWAVAAALDPNRS